MSHFICTLNWYSYIHRQVPITILLCFKIFYSYRWPNLKNLQNRNIRFFNLDNEFLIELIGTSNSFIQIDRSVQWKVLIVKHFLIYLFNMFTLYMCVYQFFCVFVFFGKFTLLKHSFKSCCPLWYSRLINSIFRPVVLQNRCIGSIIVGFGIKNILHLK